MSSTKGVNTLRWSLGLLLVIIALNIGSVSGAKDRDPERKALYRLEYIDIQKVLENHRMLTNFIKCFLRRGPCTPEARDFRKLLPKLAISMCNDCTVGQKHIIKKVFNHLMIQRPKEWQLLLDRFDPQRKYAERLHTFMADSPESTTILPEENNVPRKEELIKNSELSNNIDGSNSTDTSTKSNS
ncbi:ejaculatory bulb-specific protein 3-like [Lycorma delicatula]|uniref:ejaculatory bulb-specific protein 3-like n=1 Tax=Lycorma delicatula TaxID=130591 RepID=UPI003F5102A9